MSCKSKKKEISDLLDGRLSSKKKCNLDNHLSLCLSCRDYKYQLMEIRSQVREREKNEMPEGEAVEFLLKLKRRLENTQQQKKQKKKNGSSGFEKWAYAAAGFMVVLFLLVYFVILQPSAFPTDRNFVLSFEDAIGDLYGEINNDAELEELFNKMILASLDEALEELDIETIPFITENPIYRDDLSESEEELKYIESKIKEKSEEDIKS